MGPYKSVDADESAFDLLLSLRDRLRSEAGVNAFLAVDADVDLDEVDAATQSIAFARASNVVAFVAPLSGRNLGVGVETGQCWRTCTSPTRTIGASASSSSTRTESEAR